MKKTLGGQTQQHHTTNITSNVNKKSIKLFLLLLLWGGFNLQLQHHLFICTYICIIVIIIISHHWGPLGATGLFNSTFNSISLSILFYSIRYHWYTTGIIWPRFDPIGADWNQLGFTVSPCPTA